MTSHRAARRKRGPRLVPYLCLLPGAILLAVFSFWPAYTALILAFHKYTVIEPPEWVGLDNVRRMLADVTFWNALKTSFLFMAGIVPLVVIVPLLLALLVNQRLRGIQFFRLIYYVPVVTSMVAVAIAWNYVFHERGVINWLLTTTGSSSARSNISWIRPGRHMR